MCRGAPCGCRTEEAEDVVIPHPRKFGKPSPLPDPTRPAPWSRGDVVRGVFLGLGAAALAGLAKEARLADFAVALAGMALAIFGYVGWGWRRRG